MTVWRPGMIISADRLNDFTPVPLSITPTAATGFSLSSFTARKTGGVAEWTAILIRTGADIVGNSYSNATPGNITDILCMTFPPECRPDSEYYSNFDSNAVLAGGFRVVPGGQVYLSHVYPSATIVSGTTVRFSGAFAAG